MNPEATIAAIPSAGLRRMGARALHHVLPVSTRCGPGQLALLLTGFTALLAAMLADVVHIVLGTGGTSLE